MKIRDFNCIVHEYQIISCVVSENCVAFRYNVQRIKIDIKTVGGIFDETNLYKY